MMSFSFFEIITSLFYAIIFGLGYSLFYAVIFIIYLSFKDIPSLFCQIVVFDKILPSPSIKKGIKEGKCGPLFAFLSVLTFFLGVMFASYFALDGEIRLYMLVLSSASFYIFYLTFYDVFRTIFILLFDMILFVVTLSLRLIITPFKTLLYNLNNKITRN